MYAVKQTSCSVLLPRMSRTFNTQVGGSPESGRTTRGPTPKGNV